MSRVKIKELFKDIADYNTPFLWPVEDPSRITYPTIEGNESNFLTDYQADFKLFDRDFVHEYGERYVDFESEDPEDIAAEWTDELYSILRIYLDSWARLYYALSIDFNPVFNVEEHTTSQYGQDVNTDSYGQHQRTSQYGATQETLGTRSDSSTSYAVSFDNTTEKETGKQEDSIGQQVNSTLQHTDTHTDAAAIDTHTRSQHTDQVDRTGNIGVVSATSLVEQEIKLRRNYSFFKNCFLVIINELGAYWDDHPCFW